MDTPVPVPNTEVKHLSGDNSYACHSEDSKSPGNLPSRLTRFFVSLNLNTGCILKLVNIFLLCNFKM